MPMRRVTSTRVTRMPSSRTCKGECGSTRSRPLCGLALDSHRLAQPARPAGQIARFRVRRPVRGCAPSARSRDRLQRAQQDSPSHTLFFAGEIHAVVAAIDEVDIRVAWGPEKDFVPRRWPAMRVRRGVGRLVVRARDTPRLQRFGLPRRRLRFCGPAICRAAAAPRAPARPQKSALQQPPRQSAALFSPRSPSTGVPAIADRRLAIAASTADFFVRLVPFLDQRQHLFGVALRHDLGDRCAAASGPAR